MLSLIGLIMLVLGCQAPESNDLEDGKLRVVATTGMLYDAVVNIGGDAIQATSIMGPGVDPHLYKATQGDLSRLTAADLIVYNGLYLEGKMAEILGKLSSRKKIIAAAEAIPQDELIATTQFGHSYDPHVWFDVHLWQKVVEAIAAGLSAADADNADHFQARKEVYLARLDSLHEEVKQSISTIPKQQRTLVTAHDAFAYFGQAYDIEVQGLQGLSTASDFGLKDIANITDLVIEKRLPAIFVETSVSEKAINAVVQGCRARGHEVAIGGYLYSDAMGALGTPHGTYIGMVTANVKTIVEGLSGEQQHREGSN
ncbi:MAG: zinc ABC transporter substrate-binding protein [Bacteroidota bacterium]